MSARQPFVVISFPTTADAMAFEHYARKLSFDGKLIPVPHSLSTGCGMAWRSALHEEESARRLLEQKQIEWEEFVIMEL